VRSRIGSRRLVVVSVAVGLTIAQIYAEAARAALVEANEREHAVELQAARTDPNAFIEYAFGLTQAPIHRRLQASWDAADRTVDLFPIEHGKTTQTVARIVWQLGNHPDWAIAYVTSGAGPAMKVGRAVKRAIESNERVREVFPQLRPETVAGGTALTWWGAQSMRVAGAGMNGLNRDASFAVYGWDGQITGSRLNVVYVDNVCNRKNTYSRLMRENVLETVENDVLSRILPGGSAHVTDTSWYDDDPPHVLGCRDGWTMNVVDAHDGLDGQPVWPQQWPWERLQAKEKEIGTTAYNRTLRNITTAASAGIFKLDAFEACIGRARWRDSYDGGQRVVTAVDLGTRPGAKHDLTSFCTGVDVDGIRYQVLNVKTMRANGVDLARAFVDIYRRFHCGPGGGQFVVEDNGAQVYIVDILKNAATAAAIGFTQQEIANLHVRGRTTTVRKHDLELGVPAVAADLEMGRLLLPQHSEIAALWEEMRVYTPEDHTGDRLMSLWIMRDGLRSRGTFYTSFV